MIAEPKPAWMAKGKCRGMHGFFFPHHSEQDRQGPQTQAAKKVCEGCRVRKECLEAALQREEFGIWGGTTEKERRSLRRRRRQDQ